jgi:negative regulator of flagellin synthesis FlgM
VIIQAKGSGGVSPIFPSVSYTPSSNSSTARPQIAEGQFDKVNISRDSSGTDQFQRELVSRLVREVRTAHTSSDIQEIKSEVQAGIYKPNANEIAAKLLLEENTCGNG